MIPIQNTIREIKKHIKLSCIEAHYTRNDVEYAVCQRLFDPPLQVAAGDTITVTWNISAQ